MRRLQFPQKLVYEKFYAHKKKILSRRNLSKIYWKTQRKHVNQTTAI